MPGIVILTARFGYGHLAAALNLAEALRQEHPELPVEVVDPFQQVNPRTYRWAQQGYRFVSSRVPFLWYWFFLAVDRTRLGEWLILRNKPLFRFFSNLEATHQPATVVITYPVFSSVLDHFYGPGGRRSFRVVSVLTDSVSINNAWLRGHSDLFLVADPLTSATLKNRGILPEKILVTGFPVPPRFRELCQESVARAPVPPLQAGPSGPGGKEPAGRPKLSILFLPNNGERYLFKILRILGPREDVKVVLALGKRERLVKKVKALAAGFRCEMEVNGWVPGICYRMQEARLVITKAGGATVHEAIAAGCPVIISQVTPGQEEGNARLVEALGIGMVVRNNRGLYRLMKFFEQIDFQVLGHMRTNLEKIRRPDAAYQAAAAIARLAGANRAPGGDNSGLP